jgi:MOSC domain-containing protein YiiM
MPEPFQIVTLDAQQGRVEAIWLKRAHRGPMDPVDEAVLDADGGIVGNVDRSRRRQVTIIEREAWETVMSDLNADLNPSSRRANILVSGVRLAKTRSRVLEIGSATVLIGGEVTPCERMEQLLPGLQMAMRPDWRGGVFAQILTGGTIRVGDLVALRPTSNQANSTTDRDA